MSSPVTQPSERVRETVESWKGSLLDLSAANPLVSLPDSGTVPMAAPNDIFDPLVRRRKPLYFWDLAAPSLDKNLLREAGNYAVRPTALETLRRLHLRAVTLLQGQDINVLYVSFGILAWKDPETGETARSPLLLVPVTLEPHESGIGYVMACMEEPIEVNPVLKLRLAQPDLGITLPNAPDERYLVPSAYLSSVTTNVCEGREGWAVEESCLLGSFPLLKLRLYEDFIVQEQRALSHPLIAAIAGEEEAVSGLPAVAVPTLAEIEGSHSGEGNYLLLDADPAQERAIIAAARGQSFVLHGPPGTGKTQTITNIITECIAAGKSVLLCSGRMASLDAVHQRLIDKGIGDLCLVAHSLKTSRRDILQQLEQTLTTPAKSAPGSLTRAQRTKEREELDTVRDRLNAFVRALHEIHGPLGISVYEAAGRVADCATEADAAAGREFTFVLDAPALSVTPEALEVMEREAVHLANNSSLAAAAASPLWNGAFVDPQRDGLVDTTRTTLSALVDGLRRLEHGGEALVGVSQLLAGPPANLAEVDWLLEAAGLMAEAPASLPEPWLSDVAANPAALRERAKATSARCSTYRDGHTTLLRTHGPEIFGLDHATLREQLTTKHEEILGPLLGEQWRDRGVAECRELCDTLGGVAQKARDVHEKLLYLSEKSGLPLDESPEGRVNLLRIARRAIDLPNPCVGWFAPGATARLGIQLSEAQDHWTRYQTRANDLFSVYEDSILDLDHPSLKDTLTQSKGGLLGLLNAAAARASGAIKGTARSGASTKDRDLLRDLDTASEIRELRRWAYGASERLSNAFGSYYKEAATEWESVRAQLGKAQALCSEFSDNRVPAPLIALMLLGDSDLKEFEQVGNQVGDLLTELAESWDQLTKLSPRGAAVLPGASTPLVEIATWCDARRKALHDLHDAYRTVAELRQNKDSASADPIPVANMVDDLERAARLEEQRRALDTELESMAAFYGPLMRGRDTDWTALDTALDTAARLRTVFSKAGRRIDGPALQILTGGEDAGRREEIAISRQTLQEDRDTLTPVLNEIRALFRPDYMAKIDGGRSLNECSLAPLASWGQERLEAVDGIGRGVAAQTTRDSAVAHGLGGFFDALLEKPLPATAYASAFRAGFYRAWITAVCATTPELGVGATLSTTVGAERGKAIARFCELDRRQMDTVPAQIRELMKARSPKQYADEVKALKEQLARRRTGEVRKLLAQIPNLLFALKPCIMMNPLSVRLFLEADALRFDVVLFDDASQISTEDAVGAILRGRQVIIAGDPKQIPPLALLRSTDRPFESILDAATVVARKDSAHFSSYPLRWHYRSMNESLIAFSRRHFYPELVSFPAARVDSAVSCLNAADDPTEAPKRVVEAVLEYASANPDHSVGVITLDEIDHAAILAEIARRKEADASVTMPREDEDVEHFFVKTLENVQGDERDMVLLYVGSEPGRCAPLLASGGERLLNVATTRARHQMVVVSALQQISAADSATEVPGVRLLRAFLDYAMNGGNLNTGSGYNAVADALSHHLVTGTGTASLNGDSAAAVVQKTLPPPGTFEQMVAQALTERGHQIRTQVGVSEYRVDLAVIDPERSDRYVLGIECDGDMYASGETARHRDRLRPEMLSARGWNVHRVWALDWARDPKAALAGIEAALVRARSAGAPGKATARRARSSSAKEQAVAAVSEPEAAVAA